MLLGTEGIGSFIIVSADDLIPIITQAGFLLCGAFLCLSCFFGVISRALALRCKVMSDVGAATKETFAEHLARHKEEEKKIQAGASFWGIDLQTGICHERVLQQFLEPFPFWVKWINNRFLKKNKNNPQIAYLSHIKTLNAQAISAFFQALLFLGFLVSGFVYAALG